MAAMKTRTGRTGWIGVDLDGTLAHYEKWDPENPIGAPIPLMAERLRCWLAGGERVKIFTARVSTTAQNLADAYEQKCLIQRWLYKNFGVVLEVVCEKDFHMIELWDDRAIQVVKNTGKRVGDEVVQ